MKKFLSMLMAGCLTLSMMVPMASAASYDDISGHWAEKFITSVSDFGLFYGNGDSFMPDEAMTRGMFVTVLGRLAERQGLDTTANADAPYSDVSDSDYFSSYVTWASANGIVSGIGDGLFAPNTLITREQMCVILIRYLTWTGLDMSQYTAEAAQFLDQSSISDYAIDAVSIASQMKLIQGIAEGDGFVFQPQGTATRSAVATVFVNTMDELEIDYSSTSDEGAGNPDVDGGGATGTPTPEYTDEEIAAEAAIAAHLATLVSNYSSSTYLPTTDQLVQDTMAVLMSCINGALADRDNGIFLSREYVNAEYRTTINEMKVLHSQLSDEQYNQFYNVIMRFDYDSVEAVTDFFGINI